MIPYTDTQLIRLGGPNFHEIPINKPIVPVHNNQRDGYHRQMINKGQVSYHRNSLANDTPTPISEDQGGYRHYQEKVDGRKIQARSDSFKDHFSQAKLFWNSMSPIEKEHILSAFSFEVGKVKSKYVRQQVVEMYSNVSIDLATKLAANLGVSPPENQVEVNVSKTSPALSMENTISKLDTRKVAVILANGFKAEIIPILDNLKNRGLCIEIVSGKLGMVKALDNQHLEVKHTFLTTDSVLFDAVYAVGGNDVDEKFHKDAANFIKEAYMHYKPIAAVCNGKKWLQQNEMANGVGVVMEDDKDEFLEKFSESILAHRHWDREIY